MLAGLMAAIMVAVSLPNEKEKAQKRIAPYAEAVKVLDKMEQSKLSEGEIARLIDKVSVALKERKVTSVELSKTKSLPYFGSYWVADYRMRLRILSGNRRLEELKALANSDKKKNADDYFRAQELGSYINSVNLEVSETDFTYKPVNASRKDIANLVARVKNPSLPPVEVAGYLDFEVGP